MAHFLGVTWGTPQGKGPQSHSEVDPWVHTSLFILITIICSFYQILYTP